MTTHGPSHPPGSSGQGLLILAGVLLLGAVAFVVLALWVRFSTGSNPGGPAPAYPTAGRMPGDFESDHSRDAEAFKATCSQCHVLPSPYVHDEAGWRGVQIKMQGQMADRGISIPQKQIDLAIAYVIRHARNRPSPLSRPAYVIPASAPEAIPAD